MKTISRWKDHGDIAENLSQIGVLQVDEAGSYAIFAKMYLSQDSGDNTKVEPNQVTAVLEAENDTDTSVATVYVADQNPFRSACSCISLHVVHHFAKPAGQVVVKIDKRPNSTPFLVFHQLKITAVPVSGIDNKPLP